MSKLRARSREDKLKKSEKILHAAKEIFFERGYHETTIEISDGQTGTVRIEW